MGWDVLASGPTGRSARWTPSPGRESVHIPFNFAIGAIEAGHQPQIFLAGEAAYLMKDDVAAAIMPVAMPPLKEMLQAVVAQRVPIFV